MAKLGTRDTASSKKPKEPGEAQHPAGPVPQAAIDFFKAKGIKPGFSYKDVWQEEHSLAFTVAKVMERDILTDVRDSITKAIADGTPFREWSEGVADRFAASGWSDEVSEEAQPSRLKLIYNTNMRMARANGQADRIERTKDALPFLKYELGPSKIHRPEHVSWAGTILPVDDPWWTTHTPPLGYGCTCRVRQLTPSEAEASGVAEQSPDATDDEEGIDPSFAYDKTFEGRQRALNDALEES